MSKYSIHYRFVAIDILKLTAENELFIDQYIYTTLPRLRNLLS